MLPILHITLEKWKFRRDLNIYVSSCGRIRNRRGKEVKFLTNQTGYLVVNINNTLYLVHRLVMETFNPIKNSKEMTIDHLDHNKRNNSLVNLEWVTEKENQNRAKNDYVSFKSTDFRVSDELRETLENQKEKQRFNDSQVGNFICFGNYEVRKCSQAAEIILKEYGFPCSHQNIIQVSNRIGQIVGTNQKLYGYTFTKIKRE